jgi:hypothetical protein
MKKLAGILMGALALIGVCSCQDDVSSIGSTLSSGEVTITVDSLITAIDSKTVYNDNFDSRSLTKLIGRINVPEYGNLDCSFVSQMMSATKLAIPDSIDAEKIDSVRLIFSVPRGELTGDSLAPQQLRAYRLTKQLPTELSSDFDPTGYYSDASLLGSKSYTISNLSLPDSVYSSESYVRIKMKLANSFAKEIYNKYQTEPETFQWPSTFAKWFPGLYVAQNFGNGCIANVSKGEMYLYWHRVESEYEKIKEAESDDEEDEYGYVNHTYRDSICVFATQPEVASLNIIKYDVAESLHQRAAAGDIIMTTPGGYYARIDFPVMTLIDEYNASNKSGMAVISSLKLSIPASTISNDYDISVAPYLLMVRESEREAFFANNDVPDGVNSFYAAYDSDTGTYNFTGMRDYLLKLIDEYQYADPRNEDTDFALIPIDVTTETVTSTYSSSTYVTKCSPYIAKPTLTQLNTDNCTITFTYSSQQLE